MDCENWEEKTPTAAPSEPFEEFSDNDSMSVISGRSPKHPRTSTEDDGQLNIAALLDQAAVRFGATLNTNCADLIATVNTNIDSMMDRLEKKMDDKIDTKLGPVVDRLTALEPVVDRLTALENAVSSSIRSGPSSASDHGAGIYGGGGGGASPAVFAPSYLEIKGLMWIPGQGSAWLDRSAGEGIHFKIDCWNWCRSGCCESACGCPKSQEYKDHDLIEESEPRELQTDQRSHECIH